MLITAPGQKAKKRYLINFLKMKVYCVFSLESPRRGNSNEYTQYTIFMKNKKSTQNYPKTAHLGFSQGTPERVRNICGKQAISVRATEVLLYVAGLEIWYKPFTMILKNIKKVDYNLRCAEAAVNQ